MSTVDNNKRYPILFKNKNECCGCAACYSRCQGIKQAITMVIDEEGFFYPVVDATKCIQCLSCEKVCPLKQL